MPQTAGKSITTRPTKELIDGETFGDAFAVFHSVRSGKWIRTFGIIRICSTNLAVSIRHSAAQSPLFLGFVLVVVVFAIVN